MVTRVTSITLICIFAFISTACTKDVRERRLDNLPVINLLDNSAFKRFPRNNYLPQMQILGGSKTSEAHLSREMLLSSLKKANVNEVTELDTIIDLSSGAFRDISEHLSVTNIRAVHEKSVLIQNRVNTFFVFELAYDNVPLPTGSGILLIPEIDHKRAAIRARWLPREVDGSAPKVTRSDALMSGVEHFSEMLRRSGSIVMPDASTERDLRLEFWVPRDGPSGSNIGKLSWAFTLQNPVPGNERTVKYWISAVREREIVYWEDQIYNDYNVTVIGNIWDKSPTSGTTLYPLQGAHLSTGNGISVQTGPGGTFAFPGPPAPSITTSLGGNITFTDLIGPTLQRTHVPAPGSFGAQIIFDGNSEFELALTSSFYWLTRSKNAVTDVNPDFDTLFRGSTVVLNIADYCNASWDDAQRIFRFGRSNQYCLNSAYSDFVAHEYGHAIDGAYGGIHDGPHSEGFGDVLAVLMTKQPCFGRDYSLESNNCPRDARRIVRWPPDGKEQHEAGMIYSGFVWALVQNLQKDKSYQQDQCYAIVSQLLLDVEAQDPANIQEAVQLIFDTDKRMNDSTHSVQILDAAKSRGIPIVVSYPLPSPFSPSPDDRFD